MNDHARRAWEIMSQLDVCMLVTTTPAGLRSRPMSSIVKPDEGVVYFLTDARAAKDDEIATNANVLLAYGNASSQFVSARAQAAVSHDRGLIERLWNPGAQAFWPKGPNDPDVVAIVATMGSAEYWDGSGGLVGSVKMAVAVLTGAKPDLGDTAKVTL